MAKYYSKRKSRKKKSVDAEVDLLKKEIDHTVEYIDHWQKRELSLLLLKNIPILVPLGTNALVVGRFAVKKHDDFWHTMDTRNDKERKFKFKNSAILYALCDLKGHSELADEIFSYDNQVVKLSNDIEIYKYRHDTASKNKDYWRADYFSILCGSSQYKLEDAVRQLQKSINLAKYYKIWTS
jgi:hypothetical protein